MSIFGKKRKVETVEAEPQTIELGPSDVALILRADGRCETVCTLKGKHSLTPQEEIIIGLGGLMQNQKFTESVREHFLDTMQRMINAKFVEEAEDVD